MIAEGATLMVGKSSTQFVQRAFSGPRTLANDALSKVANPKVTVQGLNDDQTLKGTNGKEVRVFAFPNEHSDALVAVYLPAEKLLWTADVFLAGMAFNANQPAVTKAMKALPPSADRDANRRPMRVPAPPAPPCPCRRARSG